jgi:hypothetical protein
MSITPNDQLLYTMLSRVVMPLLTYTPIDLFVLADKMNVHELTHTKQVVPNTVGIDPPYGKNILYSPFFAYSTSSYIRFLLISFVL